MKRFNMMPTESAQANETSATTNTKVKMLIADKSGAGYPGSTGATEGVNPVFGGYLKVIYKICLNSLRNHYTSLRE